MPGNAHRWHWMAADESHDQSRLPEQRLRVLTIVFAICFMTLGLRLWTLQVLQKDRYTHLAERNYLRRVYKPFLRGRILDARQRLLADNSPAFELTMNVLALKPKEQKENLACLARILKCSEEALQTSLEENGRDRFGDVTLLKDMTYAQTVAVSEHRPQLPAVDVRSRPSRTYVGGNLVGHILGHMGEVGPSQLEEPNELEYQPGDEQGKMGVEGAYERFLRGKKGISVVRVYSSGLMDELVREERPSTAGGDVVLTLDLDLQAAAAEALGASCGVVIALDPRNGAIRAMVTNPGYDPNLFSHGMDVATWKALLEDPNKPLQNRAVAGVFPPGSTFKLVTAAAALGEGDIDWNTGFTCPGVLNMGGWKFHCWRKFGHGNISLTEALRVSCDVFFYQTGLKTGIESMERYSRDFGFGSTTGLDIGGEAPGLIPSPSWKRRVQKEPWVTGDTINTSIGQGFVLATPLQIACAYGALANGGNRVKPHLVDRVVNIGGQVEWEYKPEVVGQLPVTPANRERLTEAFSRVINADGTGRGCRLKNMEICGKTGTAQVPTGEPHAWFVGYGPRQAPSLVVLVLMENGGHGGEMAAPVAKKVFLKAYPDADGPPHAEVEKSKVAPPRPGRRQG